MRPFDYALLQDKTWDTELLRLIAGIYKEAGKQELYLKQKPATLKKLVEVSKIQSTEASNAIEGIVTTNTRIRQLVEVEPLITIAVFIHDFLCIYPVNDGNERMSRLLTTLLLYQNGFYVGKYISLEAKIANNKALYYEALSASQDGWHEGKNNPVPFIKYLLGTILAAYKDFEERVTLIEPKIP